MARLIAVDDPADPRLEPYRDIRERDLVGRRGGFIAEGEVVLRQLVRGGRHGLDSLLLAEKRAASLQPLLDALAPDTPVYVAPQAVLEGVAGFDLHRGILGFGRRRPAEDAGGLLAGLGERALVLGLVGIGNHDNMGGLFRNAAAFGVGALLLDATCCDPLYRKAIRVSVGAALTLPFAYVHDGRAMVDLLGGHGFDVIALSGSATATLLQVTRQPRAALLLGPEGPGLPPEVLAVARGVAILMAGEIDSLNVAVAAGVALHHLAFASG